MDIPEAHIGMDNVKPSPEGFLIQALKPKKILMLVVAEKDCLAGKHWDSGSEDIPEFLLTVDGAGNGDLDTCKNEGLKDRIPIGKKTITDKGYIGESEK
eukprot:scaffold32109_cov49-Attheya_sp.AAC.1